MSYKMRYRNIFFIILGWLCIGAGALGIVLPLLPTTVFLLIAAWSFSKGSPRLNKWLHENRYFSSYLQDWEKYGCIPVRAKVLAITMIAISGFFVAYTAPLFVALATFAILFLVSGFILTRPSARPGEKTSPSD